ncbi:Protein PIN-likeS 2 [Vitis vinifera]|uniref:Protein PIN-likeS 2 n=1 Tax=Vitis vinifera TaxID=29760 RepID=A0A438GJZ8_VITVI|nr:Protein PIN-likeS 2 [Vitis vinifera]
MDSFWDLSDGNVKSGGENWLSAVVPLMKLLSLTVIGLILAHPKLQVMSKATFRLLSKLVFVLFLLCLIFTQLGQSITGKNFVLWWFIPVNVIISTAVGCILRYLVAIICQPPPEFFWFTIIMTAFGNTGNLPLAIVGSICHSAKNPFGPDCHTSGVFYVSFAQWVAVILVYTLAYHMMEPPLEYYEIVDEGNEVKEVVTANDLSRPLLVEAKWPGMEDKESEHCKTPFIARVFTRISSISPSTFPDVGLVEEEVQTVPSPLGVWWSRRWLGELGSLLNKHQFSTYFNLLQLLLYNLSILAGATIPFVLLILGGMLVEGPYESKLGIRTRSNVSVYAFVAIYNTKCHPVGSNCKFKRLGQQMCSETAGSLDEYGKKTVGRLRERHHFFLRRKVHTGSGFGEAIWGFSGADSADFGEGVL